MLVLLFGIICQIFPKFIFLLSWKLRQFCWVSDCSISCSEKQINSFCNFLLCSFGELWPCSCGNWTLGSLLWQKNSIHFEFCRFVFFWKTLTLLVRVFHASTVLRHIFHILFVVSVFALMEYNHVDISTLDVRTSFSV